MSQPMNREQRRQLKKQGQEVNEDGQVVASKSTKTSGGGGSGSGSRVTTATQTESTTSNRKSRDAVAKEERTSPVQFVREVRTELKKVSWPTRSEVINYSLVVFFTVVVLTAFIGLLDWVFSTLVLELFEL